MKAIIILFLALLIHPQWGTLTERNGYHPGDFARDFKLKNIDGKMISMADFRDASGFIIAFTCNTCPFAILYEKRIIELNNKYASQGYPVIAINSNDPEVQPGDSFENMQRRAKDKSYPFPYLVDETQEIAKTYGATNTPHLYILKKVNNQFQVMYIGAIDNNAKEPQNATQHFLDDAMDEILSGKPVKESETRAIGCGIKWKS